MDDDEVLDGKVLDDAVLRDVLVVGGGVAGLTAAIALARFSRVVEVVDAGEPRNAPSAGVHNLLGHDGIAPLDLLAAGRDELHRFGGWFRHDTAVGATRVGGGFEVRLASGARLVARRLIVTTGVRDLLPPVEGLRERWGREVLHCPYCHGFEVRGETIGVLATAPDPAVHQAMLFRELSDDVVVFAPAGLDFSAEQRAQLRAMAVEVVEGDVSAVVVEADRLTGVRLADGRTVARQALVVAPATDARSDLLDALGVPRSDDPAGGYAHDPLGATAVPGVWIAGNVAAPFATVVIASAAGMSAAGGVNADLVAERVAGAVARVAAGAAAAAVPPAVTATPVGTMQ